jgi:hypothetical protein
MVVSGTYHKTKEQLQQQEQGVVHNLEGDKKEDDNDGANMVFFEDESCFAEPTLDLLMQWTQEYMH